MKTILALFVIGSLFSNPAPRPGPEGVCATDLVSCVGGGTGE